MSTGNSYDQHNVNGAGKPVKDSKVAKTSPTIRLNTVTLKKAMRAERAIQAMAASSPNESNGSKAHVKRRVRDSLGRRWDSKKKDMEAKTSSMRLPPRTLPEEVQCDLPVTSETPSLRQRLHLIPRQDLEECGSDVLEDPGENDSGIDSGPPKPSLACPFYKHNSMHHMGCARLRLTRIRDVKQHLSRRHRRPLHCPVCGETFQESKHCESHIRARNCQKPPGGFVFEGVSESQSIALARRVNRSLKEHEQWYTIWEILFPESHKPESPYLSTAFEETFTMVNEYWKHQGMDFLDRHIPSSSICTVSGNDLRSMVLEAVETVLAQFLDCSRSNINQDGNPTSSGDPVPAATREIEDTLASRAYSLPTQYKSPWMSTSDLVIHNLHSLSQSHPGFGSTGSYSVAANTNTTNAAVLNTEPSPLTICSCSTPEDSGLSQIVGEMEWEQRTDMASCADPTTFDQHRAVYEMAEQGDFGRGELKGHHLDDAHAFYLGEGYADVQWEMKALNALAADPPQYDLLGRLFQRAVTGPVPISPETVARIQKTVQSRHGSLQLNDGCYLGPQAQSQALDQQIHAPGFEFGSYVPDVDDLQMSNETLNFDLNMNVGSEDGRVSGDRMPMGVDWNSKDVPVSLPGAGSFWENNTSNFFPTHSPSQTLATDLQQSHISPSMRSSKASKVSAGSNPTHEIRQC
ncbi:uncharacterized protein E0L32_007629 [Thyridium curvatum]|uniref:C2H2-type domain-containing protein n=1 Tax=Thyridium curvatum TaxID=1093900 RepID=A0A507B4Y3_9PEZI|nr:uncharacterized protein E0L32_007629 [Thyridium curvatum]TPX11650.1 hypothetical protein E0L32_007629 [Thyridium curvatum]